MNCEICGQEEAAFTIIPTGEGMPQSLGPACFARSGLELAKAILPAEEIAEALGPLFVTPARQETLAKATKREKAKAPTPASPEASRPEATEAPAEEPPAAENG